MSTEPVSMPQYIGPDHTPMQGPPTRLDLAVDLAVRRGYGGYVTEEEIARDTAEPQVCVSATFDPCPQPPAPDCTIDGHPACRDCYTAHRSYDEPVD